MAEIHETVEVGNTNSSVRSASSSLSSEYLSARIEGLLRSRPKYNTAVDFEIAASKDHWSELQQPLSVVQSSSGGENENAALSNLSNREIIQSLRRQFPRKARFFVDFGEDLQLGEKIAEGGQAEIFDFTVKGSPRCVLKVFKEGSSMPELQRQWPLGMFTGATNMYNPSHRCSTVLCGTVVMNGRFAFQMLKCSGDLRKFIDKRMLENENVAPLSEVELESSMLEIAVGMKALHKDNIVHRDLKAANVLIDNDTEGLPAYLVRFLESRPPGQMPLGCTVADFECSVGVIGTGFWRAPEILQGLKDRNITPHLFTRKADVYSYAMTCYEMITGRLPFEGVRLNDYDVVFQGERPPLPEETSPWIKVLLSRCWHANPNERPEFKEIIKYIKTRSPLCNPCWCCFKI